MKVILCKECLCSKCSNKNCEYYCSKQTKNCDVGIAFNTPCDYFIKKAEEE